MLQQFMKGRRPSNVTFAKLTSKHDMKGHIKTFHEENKPFKCEICNANFGEKSNLVVRIATFHEKNK